MSGPDEHSRFGDAHWRTANDPVSLDSSSSSSSPPVSGQPAASSTSPALGDGVSAAAAPCADVYAVYVSSGAPSDCLRDSHDLTAQRELDAVGGPQEMRDVRVDVASEHKRSAENIAGGGDKEEGQRRRLQQPAQSPLTSSSPSSPSSSSSSLSRSSSAAPRTRPAATERAATAQRESNGDRRTPSSHYSADAELIEQLRGKLADLERWRDEQQQQQQQQQPRQEQERQHPSVSFSTHSALPQPESRHVRVAGSGGAADGVGRERECGGRTARYPPSPLSSSTSSVGSSSSPLSPIGGHRLPREFETPSRISGAQFIVASRCGGDGARHEGGSACDSKTARPRQRHSRRGGGSGGKERGFGSFFDSTSRRLEELAAATDAAMQRVFTRLRDISLLQQELDSLQLDHSGGVGGPTGDVAEPGRPSAYVKTLRQRLAAATTAAAHAEAQGRRMDLLLHELEGFEDAVAGHATAFTQLSNVLALRCINEGEYSAALGVLLRAEEVATPQAGHPFRFHPEPEELQEYQRQRRRPTTRRGEPTPAARDGEPQRLWQRVRLVFDGVGDEERRRGGRGSCGGGLPAMWEMSVPYFGPRHERDRCIAAAAVDNNFGLYHFSLGEYSRALERLRGAVEVETALGPAVVSTIGITYLNLAQTWWELQEPKEAVATLRQCERLVEMRAHAAEDNLAALREQLRVRPKRLQQQQQQSESCRRTSGETRRLRRRQNDDDSIDRSGRRSSRNSDSGRPPPSPSHRRCSGVRSADASVNGSLDDLAGSSDGYGDDGDGRHSVDPEESFHRLVEQYAHRSCRDDAKAVFPDHTSTTASAAAAPSAAEEAVVLAWLSWREDVCFLSRVREQHARWLQHLQAFRQAAAQFELSIQWLSAVRRLTAGEQRRIEKMRGDMAECRSLARRRATEEALFLRQRRRPPSATSRRPPSSGVHSTIVTTVLPRRLDISDDALAQPPRLPCCASPTGPPVPRAAASAGGTRRGRSKARALLSRASLPNHSCRPCSPSAAAGRVRPQTPARCTTRHGAASPYSPAAAAAAVGGGAQPLRTASASRAGTSRPAWNADTTVAHGDTQRPPTGPRRRSHSVSQPPSRPVSSAPAGAAGGDAAARVVRRSPQRQPPAERGERPPSAALASAVRQGPLRARARGGREAAVVVPNGRRSAGGRGVAAATAARRDPMEDIAARRSRLVPWAPPPTTTTTTTGDGTAEVLQVDEEAAAGGGHGEDSNANDLILTLQRFCRAAISQRLSEQRCSLFLGGVGFVSDTMRHDKGDDSDSRLLDAESAAPPPAAGDGGHDHTIPFASVLSASSGTTGSSSAQRDEDEHASLASPSSTTDTAESGEGREGSDKNDSSPAHISVSSPSLVGENPSEMDQSAERPRAEGNDETTAVAEGHDGDKEEEDAGDRDKDNSAYAEESNDQAGDTTFLAADAMDGGHVEECHDEDDLGNVPGELIGPNPAGLVDDASELTAEEAAAAEPQSPSSDAAEGGREADEAEQEDREEDGPGSTCGSVGQVSSGPKEGPPSAGAGVDGDPAEKGIASSDDDGDDAAAQLCSPEPAAPQTHGDAAASEVDASEAGTGAQERSVRAEEGHGELSVAGDVADAAAMSLPVHDRQEASARLTEGAEMQSRSDILLSSGSLDVTDTNALLGMIEERLFSSGSAQSRAPSSTTPSASVERALSTSVRRESSTSRDCLGYAEHLAREEQRAGVLAVLLPFPLPPLPPPPPPRSTGTGSRRGSAGTDNAPAAEGSAALPEEPRRTSTSPPPSEQPGTASAAVEAEQQQQQQEPERGASVAPSAVEVSSATGSGDGACVSKEAAASAVDRRLRLSALSTDLLPPPPQQHPPQPHSQAEESSGADAAGDEAQSPLPVSPNGPLQAASPSSTTPSTPPSPIPPAAAEAPPQRVNPPTPHHHKDALVDPSVLHNTTVESALTTSSMNSRRRRGRVFVYVPGLGEVVEARGGPADRRSSSSGAAASAEPAAPLDWPRASRPAARGDSGDRAAHRRPASCDRLAVGEAVVPGPAAPWLQGHGAAHPARARAAEASRATATTPSLLAPPPHWRPATATPLSKAESSGHEGDGAIGRRRLLLTPPSPSQRTPRTPSPTSTPDRPQRPHSTGHHHSTGAAVDGGPVHGPQPGKSSHHHHHAAAAATPPPAHTAVPAPAVAYGSGCLPSVDGSSAGPRRWGSNSGGAASVVRYDATGSGGNGSTTPDDDDDNDAGAAPAAGAVATTVPPTASLAPPSAPDGDSSDPAYSLLGPLPLADDPHAPKGQTFTTLPSANTIATTMPYGSRSTVSFSHHPHSSSLEEPAVPHRGDALHAVHTVNLAITSASTTATTATPAGTGTNPYSSASRELTATSRDYSSQRCGSSGSPDANAQSALGRRAETPHGGLGLPSHHTPPTGSLASTSAVVADSAGAEKGRGKAVAVLVLEDEEEERRPPTDFSLQSDARAMSIDSLVDETVRAGIMREEAAQLIQATWRAWRA